MRINVYAEELPDNLDDVDVETKLVDGRKFYAVRLYLKSAKELHKTLSDDDRSAITFWVPWKNGMNHHDALIKVFTKMLDAAKAAKSNDSNAAMAPATDTIPVKPSEPWNRPANWQNTEPKTIYELQSRIRLNDPTCPPVLDGSVRCATDVIRHYGVARDVTPFELTREQLNVIVDLIQHYRKP